MPDSVLSAAPCLRLLYGTSFALDRVYQRKHRGFGETDLCSEAPLRPRGMLNRNVKEIERMCYQRDRRFRVEASSVAVRYRDGLKSFEGGTPMVAWCTMDR
ncbi:MAG: hypothetical protein CL483_07175 [Acidobacteria bacterium]|nr:hypothetical protein [Acidobacteriota bacterium]